MDIPFKDDVTVIILLSVSFTGDVIEHHGYNWLSLDCCLKGKITVAVAGTGLERSRRHRGRAGARTGTGTRRASTRRSR